MIIEGTGVNEDIIPYLKRLKKAGYSIDTYFMKTNINLCRNRVHNRNHINIHKVLDEDVVKYHKILWNDTGKTKMHKLISNISSVVTYINDYYANTQ